MHKLFASARVPAPLEVEFTDRGVQDGPAYFSQKALDAIVIRAAREAYPEHVQAQIRARSGHIRDAIHYNITRAINNDRFLTEARLRAMGYTEAADFLRTERITK